MATVTKITDTNSTFQEPIASRTRSKDSPLALYHQRVSELAISILHKLFDNAQELIDRARNFEGKIITIGNKNPIIAAARRDDWIALIRLLLFPGINKSAEVFDLAIKAAYDNHHEQMGTYLYHLGIDVGITISKEGITNPNLLTFLNQKA